jgi:uncharacterized protein YbjT (DUF2867 family)
MRILITGASGFIGSHVIQALRPQHDIIACVRNPQALRERFPDIEVVTCNFDSELSVEDWLPRLLGIDAVINAVGIIRETRRQAFDRLHHQAPCVLFRACEQTGIDKVIQISALGADETAISHYHRSKKAADDCLKQLNLNWAIIKPSLVYGPGGKSTAFFKALSALPLIPIIDNGEQPIQPIHIDDLTATVCAMLLPNAPTRLSVDAVGPQPVSFKDMLLQYRRWLGIARPHLVSIPYPIALFAGKLAGILGNTPLTPEAIQMLRQGNTGEISTLNDVLRIAPRSFEVAMREQPAQQADHWHARLFFLRPLLRITLGLLWLLTGVISLGIYPIDQSLGLLAEVGVTGGLAPIALYGAALLDITLGIATLACWHLPWDGLVQISLILGYTFLISAGLPEYWLHPFGPITKNAPLIVATLVMLSLEKH